MIILPLKGCVIFAILSNQNHGLLGKKLLICIGNDQMLRQWRKCSMKWMLTGQNRRVANWTKNPIDFPYKTLNSGSTLASKFLKLGMNYSFTLRNKMRGCIGLMKNKKFLFFFFFFNHPSTHSSDGCICLIEHSTTVAKLSNCNGMLRILFYTQLLQLAVATARGLQYLNSIFGEHEILVSKWSWQHQLFQCNKILTPTWSVYIHSIHKCKVTIWQLTLLFCTDCVGPQYLSSGTYGNVVIEFTWALQGVCFVFRATKS